MIGLLIVGLGTNNNPFFLNFFTEFEGTGPKYFTEAKSIVLPGHRSTLREKNSQATNDSCSNKFITP